MWWAYGRAWSRKRIEPCGRARTQARQTSGDRYFLGPEEVAVDQLENILYLTRADWQLIAILWIAFCQTVIMCLTFRL